MSATAQLHALTPERRGMLAKVAVARKQLALDEDAYRDLLRRVTGGDSARLASDGQLHRLLAEFTRLGFVPSRPASARRPDRAQLRKIAALWGELAPHLADPSGASLRAFVRRQTRSKLHPGGVGAPEFCNAVQANRVVEGLKAWLARVDPPA